MLDADAQVRTVMTSPVRSVAGEQPLRKAADVLLSEGIGSLIVTEPRGIVTKTDLVTGLHDGLDAETTPVSDVMTADPVTVGVETPVQAAVDTMAANDVKRVPVVDEDDVVGIVTTTDLVDVAADELDATSTAVGVFRAQFTTGTTSTYECRGCGERIVADTHPGECEACGRPVRNLTVTQE